MTENKHPNPVNHPPHYSSIPAQCEDCGHAIECIDVTQHMNFTRGNAMKYLWRAGAKGEPIQDLEKALWYIEREIQSLKKAQADAAWAAKVDTELDDSLETITGDGVPLSLYEEASLDDILSYYDSHSHERAQHAKSAPFKSSNDLEAAAEEAMTSQGATLDLGKSAAPDLNRLAQPLREEEHEVDETVTWNLDNDEDGLWRWSCIGSHDDQADPSTFTEVRGLKYEKSNSAVADLRRHLASSHHWTLMEVLKSHIDERLEALLARTERPKTDG